MECSWPETLATTLEMVVEEVKEGREFANQLRSVLEMSGGSGSARDLVIKILKSFSNTLFVLNVKEEGVDRASVISSVQADSDEDLPCSDACKAEDSLEGCRISTTYNSTNSTPTKKNRRGCYDRRLYYNNNLCLHPECSSFSIVSSISKYFIGINFSPLRLNFFSSILDKCNAMYAAYRAVLAKLIPSQL